MVFHCCYEGNVFVEKFVSRVTVSAFVYALTYRKLRYAALVAVLASTLGGCAWGNPPVAAEPVKPQTSLVEMVSGGLLQSGTGKPELGLTLANNSERTLWAQVRFR